LERGRRRRVVSWAEMLWLFERVVSWSWSFERSVWAGRREGRWQGGRGITLRRELGIPGCPMRTERRCKWEWVVMSALEGEGRGNSEGMYCIGGVVRALGLQVICPV
jgi:hypothetical protein